MGLMTSVVLRGCKVVGVVVMVVVTWRRRFQRVNKPSVASKREREDASEDGGASEGGGA